MGLLDPEKEREVRVDAALMKLLASDTRRSVLRRLKNRNMTLSELARALDLKKATVLEHLRRLEQAELIRRREDDRLWIYYELTPRARSLVDPVGTRVMIVLGISLVALVVGASVGLMAQPYLDGSSGDTSTGTFSVDLEEDETTSGSGLSLQAKYSEASQDPQDLRAWLLDAEQADRLQRGDMWDPVVSLDVQSQEDGVALFTSQEVAPGTYRVYMRATDGTDNRQDLPVVHVRSLTADLLRTVWWQGLDDDLQVALSGFDQPDEEGWLLVTPPDGEPWLESSSAGTSTINASRLDSSAAGIHRFHYMSDREDRLAAVATDLSVKTPRIQVLPPVLMEGEDLEVHVLLDADGPLRPSKVPVVVDGHPDDLDLTHPNRGVLRVDTAQPGLLSVQVGRQYEADLMVLPDLRLGITLEDGPRLRFKLLDRDGAPVSHAEIMFNETHLGTTDTNGHLTRTTLLPEGPGLLQVTTSEGHTTAWGVQVDGWTIQERPHSLELQDFIEEELRIDVRNLEAWPVTATLVGLLDDEVVGATMVTLDGGDSRTIDIPRVQTDAEGEQWTIHAEGPPVQPVTFQDVRSGGPAAPDGGTGTPPPSPPDEEPDPERPGAVFGKKIARSLSDNATSDPGDADGDGMAPPADTDDSAAADPPGEPTPGPALVLLLVLVGLLAMTVRRKRS